MNESVDFEKQYFQQQYEDEAVDAPKSQRRLTNQEMTVTIPAMDNHGDYMVNTVTVRLLRYCPECGADRSVPWQALSYDGSRRLAVDTWRDGCNHYSGYAGHRREAQRSLKKDIVEIDELIGDKRRTRKAKV